MEPVINLLTSGITQGVLSDNKSRGFNNIINQSKDRDNSFNLCDDTQRKKANDRVFCYNEFSWHKDKITILVFLIPILCIIILAVSSKYLNNTDYWFVVPLGILLSIGAIIVGQFYIKYMNSHGWNKRVYNMNMKDNLDITNCFKDM